MNKLQLIEHELTHLETILANFEHAQAFGVHDNIMVFIHQGQDLAGLEEKLRKLQQPSHGKKPKIAQNINISRDYNVSRSVFNNLVEAKAVPQRATLITWYKKPVGYYQACSEFVHVLRVLQDHGLHATVASQSQDAVHAWRI